MFENKNNTRHGMALAALLTVPAGVGGINVKISGERGQKRVIGLGIKTISMRPVHNRLARCRPVAD